MLANSLIIPQLNTTFVEPLRFLERHFLSRHRMIDEWFHQQWQLTTPPVYGSVDLRNAGFKLAPIDMNLFPAGFNNLNPDFLSLAIKSAAKVIHQFIPEAKRIMIIPESHTRNLLYWENVHILQTILTQAQFEVRLGTLIEDIKTPMDIVLPSGKKVVIEPLRRQQDELHLADFTPDLILLNNDLSEGIPDILRHLKTPLIPPAELGWSQRLKSEHFQYYAGVVEEFAKKVDIDPWLIAPLFRHCGRIDFMQQEGMECLVINAEKLFAEIKAKYAEYNIPHQPFLIVKADAGTYGMAVMTVRNVEELKSMNRKQRTRMSMTKGGQPVHRVIIQEGVYTFETIGPEQAVAEPVVYLWGECVVGGFYRVHKERGVDENLNAPGMHFEPLAFSQTCNDPNEEMDPDACQNRFYTYGVVAQLSMLAAAREINEQAKKSI
ncbi:MAG: glutamate--cysteine ligase [Gammaproteobacteria bacterium]|nr:MAG: glutamate--cysteine ligase [Gammaproteobacteria bacterium]